MEAGFTPKLLCLLPLFTANVRPTGKPDCSLVQERLRLCLLRHFSFAKNGSEREFETSLDWRAF
jgi:hypothetical protein